MPAIKPDRLLGDLYKLRSFGTYKTGVHRPTYSPEDVASRQWFAERLNEGTGPLKIVYLTQGLSIPSFPPNEANPNGGVFWDPEADAAFMSALRADLRSDIPVLESRQHVNDPAFGVEVAELFLEMVK